ncbi:hypothetical protein FHS87_002225 [Roseomonas pecuniae]|uniref:Uncharacterized protein n=1 Tax=Muricoccus pecuniae TaxID=693023 RepID=A0A840Y3B3_9PROT|nr:hypothetical protein [Roseomonas pecuniae]
MGSPARHAAGDATGDAVLAGAVLADATWRPASGPLARCRPRLAAGLALPLSLPRPAGLAGRAWGIAWGTGTRAA